MKHSFGMEGVIHLMSNLTIYMHMYIYIYITPLVLIIRDSLQIIDGHFYTPF